MLRCAFQSAKCFIISKNCGCVVGSSTLPQKFTIFTFGSIFFLNFVLIFCKSKKLLLIILSVYGESILKQPLH